MKKSMKTLAATAAVLAMAGAAHAANVDINIYGASAQYLFWNDAADNFLTSKGCTGVTQASFDGKHGVTTGNSCTGFTGSPNVTIRYSGKASYESVRSLTAATNPDGCANGYQRKMANSVTDPSNLTCQTVTLGASDVAGEAFVQESHGEKFGPRGGGAWNVTLTGEDASSLTHTNPLVVPFGFFVNNAVTAKKCTTAAGALAGEYCMVDADCGGTAGSCGAASTIDNITRLQAVNIFSGYAADWSDFGAYFTAQPIVACIRHAGSGTAAAMDYSVMRGNGWGNALVTYEEAGRIWFNEGSSDLIKCVNGNSTVNTTGSLIGAIGYADADQATGTAGTSQNVKAIKYNGAFGTRYSIRNGLYDFWTTQWVYEDPTRTTAAQRPVVDALTAFAAVPGNVPSTKAKHWATADEMKFYKGSEMEYPYLNGALDPQTP